MFAGKATVTRPPHGSISQSLRKDVARTDRLNKRFLADWMLSHFRHTGDTPSAQMWMIHLMVIPLYLKTRV